MLVNNNLTVINAVNGVINLLGKQGTTWGPLLISVKLNGAPVNLTGYLVRGQMRKKVSALNPEPGLTFALADAANGVVSMSMSAENTAKLACGDSAKDAASSYVWDMEIYKDNPNEVSRFFRGTIRVEAEVTR